MNRLIVLSLAFVALGAWPAAADDAATAATPGRRREQEEASPRSRDDASTNPVRLGLFFLESADGSHRLELNGRLMIDGRFAGGDDDGFQVRRARVDLSGQLADVITFRLGLELGRAGHADLRDAYVNLVASEGLQLRLGQMLVPFSTEGRTSSNFMKLPERPILVASLADSRELGLMVHGRLLGGTLTYAAAIFNGNGQNRVSDDDDGKDVALRLEVAPQEGLLLAASYRYTPPDRHGSRGPSDLRTLGNRLTRFLDYDTANNRHRSRRERGSLEARVRAGPLEVKGEVLFDRWHDVTSGKGERRDLLNWGWFADASYVLTGEASQEVIAPARPFHARRGLGPGAWELSARYEEVHADAATVTHGFAQGARTVRSATLGLTWIPVKGVRALLSYTYSALDGLVLDPDGDRRAHDHAVVMRLGLWF